MTSLCYGFSLFVWGKWTLRCDLSKGKVREGTEEGQRELQEKQKEESGWRARGL